MEVQLRRVVMLALVKVPAQPVVRLVRRMLARALALEPVLRR